MSWLFSRALVEESSGECCLGGEQSVLWNSTPTRPPSWLSAKMTEPSRLSRSGMTCELLTASRGEAVLMLFLEGFPVRTFPPQDVEPGSRGPGAGSGGSSPAYLGRFDPASHSLKTPPSLFPEDSMLSSPTLPRWGLVRGGELWGLTMAGLLTSGTESGFWRTPSATEGSGGGQAGEKRLEGGHTMRLRDQIKSPGMWPTPSASDNRPRGNLSTPSIQRRLSSGRQVNLSMVVHGDPGPGILNRWPTPSATDGDRGGTITPGMTGQSLPQAVNTSERFPTPRATDGSHGGPNQRDSKGNPSLANLAAKFPTPKSRDWKGQSQRVIHGPMDSLANLDRGDGAPIGGQLNPSWVEWLMGWPIGWTDCEPLATDRFHEWLRLHGRP